MMNGDSSWCSITSGGRVSDRLNPGVSLHVTVCRWFIRFSPGDVILHSYLHVLLLADMCLLKKQQSCWRRSIVRWNGSAVTLETTGWVSTDVFLRNYHETSERGDNVGLTVTETVLVDVTKTVEWWRVSHRVSVEEINWKYRSESWQYTIYIVIVIWDFVPSSIYDIVIHQRFFSVFTGCSILIFIPSLVLQYRYRSRPVWFVAQVIKCFWDNLKISRCVSYIGCGSWSRAQLHLSSDHVISFSLHVNKHNYNQAASRSTFVIRFLHDCWTKQQDPPTGWKIVS